MTQMLLNTSPVTPVNWVDYINPVPAPDTWHFVILSDVHLGHDRVRCHKMIADLEFFLPPERLTAIDFIIITGDLFDQRLPHDGDDAYLIGRWMERLLRLCVIHNVKIRILEGTPSHDQKQSRWMLTYNDIMGLGADVKYYEDLSIDELFPGGPTALYIPDEVNHDANRTWVEVNELMRDRAMDKVNFIFSHGFYQFQTPASVISSHNEERYESICTDLIVNGHDHTHKVKGKVRVPGSPDRHMMGQEEDKGFLQFSYSKTRGVFDELFVINHRAVIFTTLDVVGKTQVEVEKILTALEDAPDGSNFRLKVSRLDESYANFARLKARFPHFKLSNQSVESKKTSEAYQAAKERPILTSIRPDTITGLALPKLTHLSPEALKVAEAELNS